MTLHDKDATMEAKDKGDNKLQYIYLLFVLDKIEYREQEIQRTARILRKWFCSYTL